MSSKIIPDGFCILPWMSLYIENDGVRNVCCHYKKETPDWPDINSEDQSNFKEIKNLRKKMLDGRWAAGCSTCKSIEDQGGVSHREKRNDEFKSMVDSALKSKGEPLDVYFADLRLGNSCNLRCRMCDPLSSRPWANDWNKIYSGREKLYEAQRKKLLSSWSENDSSWYNIRRKLKTLKQIEFAGGEPFLMKDLADFLYELVQSGESKDITLSFITNLTLLPNNFTNLFSSFKAINITVSLDATKKMNDYIRSKSNFEKIHQNLLSLDKNFKQWNINRVGINTTYQALNCLEIKDLCDYLQPFKYVDKLPYLNILFEPAFYQVRHVPDELKKTAITQLEEIIDNFPEKSDWRLLSFNAAISALKQKSDKGLFNLFKRVTLKVDTFDQTHLREINPRLYSYLFL